MAELVDISISQDEITRINDVAKWLQKAFASNSIAAEADLSISNGYTITSRNQEVEYIENSKGIACNLTIYNRGRKASVSLNSFAKNELEKAISQAKFISERTESDLDQGLPDPELHPKTEQDLALSFTKDYQVSELKNIVRELESEALDHKEIINTEGASFNLTSLYSLHANSNGFIGDHLKSKYSLSCVVIAKDGDSMVRDGEYSVARDPNELSSALELGQKTKDKTIARVGARKITTRKSPVIYSAEVASSLISPLLQAISGANQHLGNSFIHNKLGQKVAVDRLSIYEDPFLAKGLSSSKFDLEGVKTKQRTILQDGVLEGYLLDSFYARKMGMASTGNSGGCHNIIVSHDHVSLQEMLTTMGTGFLVTELIGQGVNLATGDYSKGAFGYWVENGEIQFPVHEVTVAGNLKDMLTGIVNIGSDVDYRRPIRTGSILIDQLTIAGA
jgi:PmbA protein